MSVKEIEQAILQLPNNELVELMGWLEQHHHRLWDKQIENDLESGRLDAVLAEVDKEYEAGLRIKTSRALSQTLLRLPD